MLTPEDLLVDDCFVAWTLSEGKAHHAYWKQWLDESEEHRLVASQAQALLRDLHVELEEPTTTAKDAWLRLQQKLEHVPKRNVRRLSTPWLQIAAAVLVVLSLATWLMWPNPANFRTDFAEYQQISLPDGTIVDLRANSHLWWEGQWAAQNKREVFLEGEAYFAVSSAQSQKGMPFIVKANSLDIKVLGTEFNVVNRSNRKQVTLVEGSVSILDQPQPLKVLEPQQQYNWQKHQLPLIKTVKTKTFTDWRNQRWHFDEMPLEDIALRIEEHYGKEVIISNKDLNKQSLSGTAPAENLEMLIKAISLSLDLDAQLKGERIIFSAKQPQ